MIVKKRNNSKKTTVKDTNGQTLETERLMNGETANHSRVHNDNEDLEYSYKPSLSKVLVKAVGWYFFIGNVFKFFHDCLLLSTPLILG